MLRVSVAVALAMTVSACASVVRGTSEQMAFVSDPPGATMTSSTKDACPATPCSLEVERTDEFDVTFAKAGYRPETVPVRTRAVTAGGAAMAGNILVGGLIGVGVDAATGAAMDHFPNPVVAKLVPEGAAPRSVSRRRKVPSPAPAT